MRGCYILKITKYAYFIMLVIFVYFMRGTHSILPKPTQFNPRKILFMVIFSCETFRSPREFHGHQKIWNFLAHLLIPMRGLPENAHSPKTPTQKIKSGFPRKLVRVRFHWKWCFKLYNVGYWDESLINYCSKIVKIPEFNLVIFLTEKDWRPLNLWKVQVLNFKVIGRNVAIRISSLNMRQDGS